MPPEGRGVKLRPPARRRREEPPTVRLHRRPRRGGPPGGEWPGTQPESRGADPEGRTRPGPTAMCLPLPELAAGGKPRCSIPAPSRRPRRLANKETA
eukprot:11569585-Alexandrium_andersonii.AAC.1